LSGREEIFVTDLSMEDRILILSLSTSRIGTFRSSDSFGLSIGNFLISKLASTSNEIPSLFFLFSYIEEEDENLFSISDQL
jgi:hypothetical protein